MSFLILKTYDPGAFWPAEYQLINKLADYLTRVQAGGDHPVLAWQSHSAQRLGRCIMIAELV